MLRIVKDFIGFLNGFRKWTIMASVLVIGSVFLIKKYLTGAEFVSLIVPCTIAFFGINGIEHMTSTIKDWLKIKAINVTGSGDKDAG